MKASDFIVEYLIKHGIKDIFGYPGGMVTHLMDSLSRYSDKIHTHLTYHEQGAAFAACGYAQAMEQMAVVFATSGPGATNLITGICNAYYDSVPVLFITGQVNTFEAKGDLAVRQKGFQETDIISMVKGVTKYAAYVKDAAKLRWYLDKAVYEAVSGRKGPVILDIPMDIFCTDIDPEQLEKYNGSFNKNIRQAEKGVEQIKKALSAAKKPVILVGSGVKNWKTIECLRKTVKKMRIPVISSMLAVDIMGESEFNYGFIGAYGDRTANFIAGKCDLLICFGVRLDIRQTGRYREAFAPHAVVIRIDIDAGELSYKVHSNEISIAADACDVIQKLSMCELSDQWSEWNKICDYIKVRLKGIDDRIPNKIVRSISRQIPDGTVITTDVGQNQVWIAQSFEIKDHQRILYSGGHGAMGYSLPAAAGVAAAGISVYSFNGDGGFQMNMQEMQTVAREDLPVKVIIMNNHALGMIRHFQEMYFQKNYFMTVGSKGYSDPDFEKIASAYGFKYTRITGTDQIDNLFHIKGPEVVEVILNMDTYVFPKLEYGKPNYDQEPLLERDLLELLMDDESIMRKIKDTL